MIECAACFLVYFLLVNTATWMLFRRDKTQALAGRRRVPEKHLLTLAALGGSPAAQAARKRFRHKTQKQPFASNMRRIIRIQKDLAVPLVALAAIALWQIYLPSGG